MVKRFEECLNLRSTLAEITKSEWVKDTKGGAAEVVPLPPLMDGLNCRAALRKAQLEFPSSASIILQKRAEFGSKSGCFKQLAPPSSPLSWLRIA